jgi:hypothetical protein
MRTYQKVLAEFQDLHKDLLKTGRFMDTQGFHFQGSHNLAMAKSFISGKKTGVVVWNISEDTPLDYFVSVRGKNAVSLHTPEGDTVLHPEGTAVLAPQSIALIIFE